MKNIKNKKLKSINTQKQDSMRISKSMRIKSSIGTILSPTLILSDYGSKKLDARNEPRH